MKVEDLKMKMRMFGVKNFEKNIVGFFDESRKLKVVVDLKVFDDVFEENINSLMMEVEMIVDGLSNDVLKFVKFVGNDENYDVYLNGVKYEFDY